MKLIPVASDGWRFILPLLIIGGGLLFVGSWFTTVLGILVLGLGAFCLYFFRDFDRRTPLDDSLIYSPGDGRVLEVGKAHGKEFEGWHLIRIFLSVLNGHVQRAPMAGKIQKVVYKKGVFLDARHPQAHFQNEQNAVTLSSEKGTVVITQIAGLIARRIVCWINEGDELLQGQRYGLIRFGSQVDVVLPPHVDITIKEGQKVKGGKTVLAKWHTS